MPSRSETSAIVMSRSVRWIGPSRRSAGRVTFTVAVCSFLDATVMNVGGG
jgi:hypothetical protein